MTSITLENARVLYGEEFVDDRAIVMDGAQIVDVRPAGAIALADTESIDLDGLYLTPGFVDIQVNGGGDRLFNDDASVETIRRIANAHRQYGTTGLLPTLISTDTETMRTAIHAVDQAIEQGVPGILGIHLEGPLLCEKRKGVHDSQHFAEVSADLLDLICSLTNGITLATIAVDRVDARTIRVLRDRGIVLCAGHTDATYEVTKYALSAGVTGFTHLFNAMSPLQSRAPGAVGAALGDIDSFVGIIADGEHVHWGSLAVALKAKRRGKCVLVTDAMPPVGGEKSEFRLGGQTINCAAGRCTTEDGTLAGSALDMASAVRLSQDHLGISLAEACRMASAYPSSLLGLSSQLGAIQENHFADLIAFDDSLAIKRVWIRGVEYPTSDSGL